MNIINQYVSDVKCTCGDTPKVMRDQETCEYVIVCCKFLERSLSLPFAVKKFKRLMKTER